MKHHFQESGWEQKPKPLHTQNTIVTIRTTSWKSAGKLQALCSYRHKGPKLGVVKWRRMTVGAAHVASGLQVRNNPAQQEAFRWEGFNLNLLTGVQMGFLVSQHGQLGAIPPPPFLSVSPLESMRTGGAIPPMSKRTCQMPPQSWTPLLFGCAPKGSYGKHSVLRVLRRFWEGFWGRVPRGFWEGRPFSMGFTVKKGSEKGSQKRFWEGGFQEVPRTPPRRVRPLRRAPYLWKPFWPLPKSALFFSGGPDNPYPLDSGGAPSPPSLRG